MTPAVSVLMTAYNRADYIAASIESVLAQTFSDFELVIVDDCSTDGTLDIAREYETRDRRVRVVRNERNLGDYGNRNRAADLASAPLLKYHDSDDLMYPHCLEVMVAMLSSAPDAAFALSASHAWPGGPCPMLLTPRMAYQREFLGGGLFMCGPASALFRSEAFRALGKFPLSGPHSDSVFWLRAFTTASCVLAPADLFWYRIHAGQHLRSERGQYDGLPLFRVYWDALGSADCPLTAEERVQARRNRVYHLVKRMLQDCMRGRWHFAAERLRQSGLSASDWVRYLRRPVRSAVAGTPLAADGEFLTPSWVRTGHGTRREQ